MKSPQPTIKKISDNRKVQYRYQIIETLESGICLQGTEIKALRASGCNLSESFVRFDDRMEAWIYQMSIPHYAFGNIQNHEMDQRRKLLLHKKEIKRWKSLTEQKDLSCIPLKIYLKRGRIKLQIALGKPKKLYDNRET